MLHNLNRSKYALCLNAEFGGGAVQSNK